MSDYDTLSEIHRVALDSLAGVGEPVGLDDSEILDLVNFVRERSEPELVDSDVLDVLDRLARKIEITGILHRAYDRRTMKPKYSDGLAPAPAVEALMCLLLEVFVVTGDFRYLNTVLKAADGVLRSPAVRLDHRLLAVTESFLQTTPISD